MNASFAAAEISRAEINKANAQHSTGPITAEGKAKSSLNAVKTALTGRTVLLPTDDADAYRNHIRNYVDELAPVGPRESELVQSLADHAWRLNRLVALEMSIYAVGQATLASDSDEHPSLIQYRTHLAHEKQLRNLQIQEARLRRYREKDTAELKQLQQTRRAEEQAREDAEPAVALYLAAQAQGNAFDPAAHGFEFSTAQIERFAVTRKADNPSARASRSDDKALTSIAA